MNIGDKVTPKSAALWLAEDPADGDYFQDRENTVIFSGVGEVIEISHCYIDYNEWERIDAHISGREVNFDFFVGAIRYTSVLVKASNGEGWAGESALLLVNN